MAVCSIPLRERVYRTKYRHPILASDVVGRPSSYKNWDNEKMTRAHQAVLSGMTVRRAAEEFAVPRSTLHDRVSGKVQYGCKSGPRRYLNSTEEMELANFITGCASLGYSRTKKQIIEAVQRAVDKKEMNVTVSMSWWKSFITRHKNLTLRDPETLSHTRIIGGSDAILEKYFDLLEKTIDEAKLNDRPCQIFNLDETGFPLSPKPPKIVSRKGEKHPSCVTGNDKCQITVLSCCNAGGYIIPPLVIFDRKTLKLELTEGEVPGTMYALSDSGWMDSEIFENWFTNHFLVYVPPSRPILLLMDGHSSHFSPVFVNKAAEEQIIVFCLPPNSTHKTQPLDKGVFGPLKRIWREECHSYLLNNPGKVITRFQFSTLFGRAWMRAMTPHNIVSGFRTTGVYPTDRFKILTKTPPRHPTLCERTGLKFIPLFTPVHHSSRAIASYNQYSSNMQPSHGIPFQHSTLSPSYAHDSPLLPSSHTDQDSSNSCRIPIQDADLSPSHSIDSLSNESLFDANANLSQDTYSDYSPMLVLSKDSHSPSLALPFTHDEVIKYTRRMEEGYDISTDRRYNYWLSLQSKDTRQKEVVLQRPAKTVLTKFLTQNQPSIKYPDIRPKSSARVITSAECRYAINEKQRKKDEEIKQKEARKVEREMKKLEKMKAVEKHKQAKSRGEH